MIVAVKEGCLFAIEDLDAPTPSSGVILDITDRTCDNGERGLQSVVPHPNFDENKWIYISTPHYPTMRRSAFWEILCEVPATKCRA